MLEIVYRKNNNAAIERFSVITKLDDLFDLLSYETVSFLAIPSNGEGEEIVDFLTEHKIKVQSVLFYGSDDLIKKIKLFFSLADGYAKIGFKTNITMKHDYLDGILK